ncbi:MAG: ATP-binding protein [Bacteroidota bacterium]
MNMSLLQKMVLFTSLLLITAISILFFSAHQTGHKLLEEVGNAKAMAVIEIGKADVEHMMLVKKPDKIRNALMNIESTGEASSVAVLRADGRVFFSSTMMEDMAQVDLRGYKSLPRQPLVKYFLFKRNDSTFQKVLTPFLNKPECYACHDSREKVIGYLMATVPLQDLEAIAAVHRTSNIYLIVFTFVGLALSIFAVMYFLVARPTRLLNSSMKRVMEGIPALRSGEMINLAPSSVNRQKDEIGELSRLFVHLVEQLNTAYQQLLLTHRGELARADQLSTTGEMAASVAHEIKNPVAGLSAALQVFRRDIPESDSRLEIVDEMLEQVERINHAVNDLLSYARPAKPQFAPVDLGSILTRTVMLLQPVANESNVTFRVLRRLHLPEFSGDEKLLQQLLWNLMLNAVQSMPRGGVVSIDYEIVGKVIRLEINDQGKGIPPKNLNLIFKPFFTTKHKGSGLGMSISKGIVEQHGGTLTIDSVVDQGTTIKIILPIEENNNEI